ncbi:hypothetical protein KP509_31G007700 [Ceratopteris richardii]|uniref:Uncharacterized protein n=1 Tax=Ceratopteris richardii TaxID=49495 RepID=A0A8T2QWZ6_CERRI|nr:hypothetical protein KP509_31G007700 [Ceratopteris richardii]
MIVSKKEQMIERNKHVERQFHSAFKRNQMVCKSLEDAYSELRAQNKHLIKRLSQMRKKSEACEAAFQEDFKIQALCLQKQIGQIQNLETIITNKEKSLQAKCEELEVSQREIQRLMEEYKILKRKYDLLAYHHAQLQDTLVDLENKLNMCSTSNPKYLPDCDSISTQCNGIPQEHSKLSTEIEAGSNDFEDPTSKGNFRPLHGSNINGSSFVVDYTDHGVTRTGRSRTELLDHAYKEQFCQSNDVQNLSAGLSTKLDVAATHCKSEKIESPKAIFNHTESTPMSFLPSTSNLHNKWKLTNHVFVCAEDDSYMGTKPEPKVRKGPVESYTSPELQKIQEEIEERERRWKRIEANMRAELDRRKMQLHEAHII